MLSLYNSLTRKMESFEPLEDREVKMFTCGPSVYQRQHIGNFRTFLFEDVLQRYLEYLGYRVIRALNFTDIELKSIREAREHNRDVLDLTREYGRIFCKELTLLKAKPPTYNPRSSTSVKEAVELIEDLIKKGYAYWYKGNVYFDPLKFKEFGKLAHLDMSRWPTVKRRFHQDTYPGQRWNLGDFILWHGYQKGDAIYWDTALGRGRPAWNVQDPAMVVQTLGYSLDIWCGGVDNIVRHHDYTIAVVESVSGKPLARYWLHCAHLLVDGKKMSKSKGNVISVDGLITTGFTPEDIRFFLINKNYNKKLNFTRDAIEKTSQQLKRAWKMIDRIRCADALESDGSAATLMERLKLDFESHMDDNLDVKQAFHDTVLTLEKLTRLAEKHRLASQDGKEIIRALTRMDSVLQVFCLSKS